MPRCVCVSFFQVYLVYVSLQAPPLSLCVWVFFLAVYLHHVHAVPEGGGVIWEVGWVMELHFERVLGIKHWTFGKLILPFKTSCYVILFYKIFYFCFLTCIVFGGGRGDGHHLPWVPHSFRWDPSQPSQNRFGASLWELTCWRPA